MKKFLPIILLLAGIIVLVLVFVVVKGGEKEGIDNSPKEEMALLELTLEERPVVSLTPTTDGHYLNMKVEKIGFGPYSMDYELLYQVPGGVQQGVPGSVNLEGMKEYNADLLLGSESSGKFRYDEGVEEGTLSLRFRNAEGQLLVKFATEFHLQNATNLLTSLDNKFKYELDRESGEFFVVMNTIGIPDNILGSIEGGSYGIFSSTERDVSGKIDANFENIYYWNNDKWEKLEDSKSTNIDIFVGSTS